MTPHCSQLILTRGCNHHTYISPTYKGISQPPPHSIVRLGNQWAYYWIFTSCPSSLHYLVTSLILTYSLWESKVLPAQWQHCITVRHISCYLIQDLWRWHFSLRKTNSICWISYDILGPKGLGYMQKKRYKSYHWGGTFSKGTSLYII